MSQNKIGFKCVCFNDQNLEIVESIRHASKRSKQNNRKRASQTTSFGQAGELLGAQHHSIPTRGDRKRHAPLPPADTTTLSNTYKQQYMDLYNKIPESNRIALCAFVTPSNQDAVSQAQISSACTYHNVMNHNVVVAGDPKRATGSKQNEKPYNLPLVLTCCVNGHYFDTKVFIVCQATTSHKKCARNTGPRPLSPIQMFNGVIQLSHNLMQMNNEGRSWVQLVKIPAPVNVKNCKDSCYFKRHLEDLDNNVLPGAPPLHVAKRSTLGHNGLWALTPTDLLTHLVGGVSRDNKSVANNKTESQKLQTDRIPFEFIRRVQAVMRAEMLVVQALLCKPGTHASRYTDVTCNPCLVLYMTSSDVRNVAQNGAVLTGSLAADCVDVPTHMTGLTLFDEALKWATLEVQDGLISSITHCDKESIKEICNSIVGVVQGSDGTSARIDNLWASLGLMHYLKNNPITESMITIDSYSCAIIETLYYYIYFYTMLIDNRIHKNSKTISENNKKIDLLNKRINGSHFSRKEEREVAERKVAELLQENEKLRNVNHRNGAAGESNGQWTSSLVKRTARPKCNTAKKDCNFATPRALLEKWMVMLNGELTWMLNVLAGGSSCNINSVFNILKHRAQANVQNLDDSASAAQPSTAEDTTHLAQSRTTPTNGKQPMSKPSADEDPDLSQWEMFSEMLKEVHVDTGQENSGSEHDDSGELELSDNDDTFGADGCSDNNTYTNDDVVERALWMWSMMDRLLKHEQVYLKNNNGRIYPVRNDSDNQIRSIAYVTAPQPRQKSIGLIAINTAIEFIVDDPNLVPIAATGVWKQTGPCVVLPACETPSDADCQMQLLASAASEPGTTGWQHINSKMERLYEKRFDELSESFPDVMSLSTSPTRSFLVFIEVRLVTAAVKKTVQNFRDGVNAIVTTGNTSYHAVCMEASSRLTQHMHVARKTPAVRYELGAMGNKGPDNSQMEPIQDTYKNGYSKQANSSRACTFADAHRLPYAPVISVRSTLLPNAKIRDDVLKQCNLGDGESLEVCSTTYEVAGGNAVVLAEMYNRSQFINCPTRQRDFLVMLLVGCSHIAHITNLATWGLSHGVNYPVKKSEVNTAPDYPHLFYTVYQIYVQSIGDVAKSCCGTPWEGSYPAPISLGTTFAGLDNMNFNMDRRIPCTMQLNAETHYKLYQELCRTTYTRIGADRFAERPKSTVGIPYGLIPGVHKAADEYTQALIRTQKYLRTENNLQSDLSIFCITPRAQKIGPITKTPLANAYCTNDTQPERTNEMGKNRQRDVNNTDLRMCITNTWSMLMETVSMTDPHLMNPYQNGVEAVQMIVLIASAISAIARSHAVHVASQCTQSREVGVLSAEEIADKFHALMVQYVTADSVQCDGNDANRYAIYNMKAAVGVFFLGMLYPHSHKNNSDIMHPVLAKLFPRAFFDSLTVSDACNKGYITSDDQKSLRNWFRPFKCSFTNRCAWHSGIRSLVVRFIKEGPRHDLIPTDYKETSKELEATVRASYWFYSFNGTRTIANDNPLSGITSPQQVSRIHFTGVFTPRTPAEFQKGACSSIVGMAAPHLQQLCHMMATKLSASLQVRHVLGQYTVKASSDADKDTKQSYVVGCGTETDTQGELHYRYETCRDAIAAQSFNTSQLIAAITQISNPLSEKQRFRGGKLHHPTTHTESCHPDDSVSSRAIYKEQLKAIGKVVDNGIKTNHNCLVNGLPWPPFSSESAQ